MFESFILTFFIEEDYLWKSERNRKTIVFLVFYWRVIDKKNQKEEKPKGMNGYSGTNEWRKKVEQKKEIIRIIFRIWMMNRKRMLWSEERESNESEKERENHGSEKIVKGIWIESKKKKWERKKGEVKVENNVRKNRKKNNERVRKKNEKKKQIRLKFIEKVKST